MFAPAARTWPSRTSAKLSNAYDENVVKPPKMPVNQNRRTSGASEMRVLAAPWGLGHTLSLVVVGVVLVVLRAQMPVRVADLFEFFVAVMLIALGSRAIVLAVRQGRVGPAHTHHHGHILHRHAAAAPHVH